MDNSLSYTMIINYPRNPYLHTTKTTRDHADDGIMEMIQLSIEGDFEKESAFEEQIMSTYVMFYI